MKVLHYYAKINENNICYGFETLAKKLKQDELPSNLIPLPEYNETVLWKKWDRELKAWSSESYEPETNFELLEKIDGLEEENIELKLALAELAETQEVKITGLQLAIAELAESEVK